MTKSEVAVPTSDIDAGYRPLRVLVRDELRQLIIDGIYPPGTRLIEKNLSDQLGVSRVPIREALRALETEGFLRTVPRKGVEVVRLSIRDIEELFDVREALDTLACAQAAERANADELQQMRGSIERARQALADNDPIALGAANEAFHDAILALSHNTLLQAILEPVQGRLHWLLRQIGDPDDIVDEHVRLLDAIESGDPVLSGQRAREHARLTRQIVLQQMPGEHPTHAAAPRSRATVDP